MAISTILNYILAINIRENIKVLKSSMNANPPVLFQFQNGELYQDVGKRKQQSYSWEKCR